MMPDYLVDAHHHLWDLSACKHTWLAETGVIRFFGDPAPIQRDYHAPDLIAEFGALPVKKSVHIQCGVATEDAVTETEWLDTQAEAHGFPHAIVAFCDLTAPGFERLLDAHGRSSRLRGIRQIVGRSAKEDRETGTASLLADPAFLTGLHELAARDLSFDLQLTSPLMKASAEVFAKTPNLSVALCHCGSPDDFSDTARTEWLAGLKALAELPQLICKISGFGMFNHYWTEEGIRPHVLDVIDIFGPDRVAFGSNFPVDKLHASYAQTMGAYLNITNEFSASERAAMFSGTAERFYRI